MAQPRHRAHGARAEPLAGHDRGVDLDRAQARKGRAIARVEFRIGLEPLDRRTDCVQRARALLEKRPAGLRGCAHAPENLPRAGVLDPAGPAVDDNGCAHESDIDRLAAWPQDRGSWGVEWQSWCWRPCGAPAAWTTAIRIIAIRSPCVGRSSMDAPARRRVWQASSCTWTA